MNQKKWYFYLNQIYFLEYIMFLKDINIKVKKIEVIKNLPKPYLICDIKVFSSFTKFYE